MLKFLTSQHFTVTDAFGGAVVVALAVDGYEPLAVLACIATAFVHFFLHLASAVR